jgi:hypothetical protein
LIYIDLMSLIFIKTTTSIDRLSGIPGADHP